MHRNDDESDFQAGGEGVDKGDDQDDRSQGCSSRIDRTEGDRDLNNESGCETEDLRGSYGCGPEAPRLDILIADRLQIQFSQWEGKEGSRDIHNNSI